jgi:adenylate cyclase
VRVKAMGASLIVALFVLLILGSGYYLFAYQGIWINMAYPLNNVLLTFISVTAYNYAVEERYAKKIRAMFSSYVTERIVNELIRNPGMAKLGGERREVTVLFSDVVGFTSFSEKHSPEEVVAILNEYLGAMTDIIFKWEGTLDKFVGDAIVAFWGAPMKQENHAELAVRCALDMVRRLERLQRKWKVEGKPVLDSGIGINTGEVLVGNIGAEGKKMDYTVIGDHVNLGSRVEGLTRKYKTHILITEFTLEKIKEAIQSGHLYRLEVKGLEKAVVKGKEKPVEIYEIRSLEKGKESVIIEWEGKAESAS